MAATAVQKAQVIRTIHLPALEAQLDRLRRICVKIEERGSDADLTGAQRSSLIQVALNLWGLAYSGDPAHPELGSYAAASGATAVPPDPTAWEPGPDELKQLADRSG
jgi:hypothetical protein